jgi:hypothetical protein
MVLVALPLAVAMVQLSGVAFADVQVTPNAPPDSSKCSLGGPSAQCGQWTYWAALGALIIVVAVAAVVLIRYLKDAPRFQVEEARSGPAGRVATATQAASRPLAPPPTPVAVAAAGPMTSSETAPAGTAGHQAAQTSVAVADPPGAASATAPPAPAAPAAAPAAAAEGRPPSPRHEPVEPDQETFDRVLAEQLAKGTDRRVAEGRAKAAALKAAREKSGA